MSVVSSPPAREWTPAQQQAIAARARTLVAAAAGSGKTSVLTELVATALAAGEVDPAQVCAVTFTEKAAQEMRGRIAHRLGELGARDVLGQVELARIGTIHSLCSAILRTHGAAVGVDPNVGQLDEAQHAWILRDVLRHVLEELADDGDVHWLRARAGDERLEATLRSTYFLASQGDGTARLVDPADVDAVVDPKSGEAIVDADSARRAVATFLRLWSAFDAGVRERKHELGRISFDDLERLAVEAARIDEVRTDLRARWGLVLVDEFQDTNARQYELLDAIGGDRLFMVGDEWQSIYRFRGADVDVFRARRADPAGGTVVPMRENFRSDAPVLDVVNRIFGNERLFGDRYEDVHPGTERQRSVPGPAVELLVVPDPDGEGREAEARRVAERIAQLVEAGEATPGEIAVLYARGTGVDHYERALRAWGLPVLRDASAGFYDQRDVRDVLALLALVRNHADDHAALAVLAGPLARLEWDDLARVVDRAREAGTSLLAAAGADEHDGCRAVAAVVRELDDVALGGSLVELVGKATGIERFELGAALAADGAVRIANLRRLVELAASAEQVGVRELTGFLEFVDAQRRDARVGEASIADEATGAVRLMTIHAAKGLEFPHVFVVEAGSRDRGGSVQVPPPLRDEHGVVHVALPTRRGTLVRTPRHEELHLLDSEAEREESLRLWYVAMTRAQQRLYVSGRWNFTPTKAGKPRAMSGALAWLRDVLELPDDLGGAESRRAALDDLVLLDCRAPARVPEVVWDAEVDRIELAPSLQLPEASTPSVEPARPDPHALRALLRDAVGDGRSAEWRQLAGTRLHDAIARLVDAGRSGTPQDQLLDPEHGPWLTDSARERLAPVVASSAFQRLVELRARTEVPYVAGTGSRVDSRAVPGAEVAASIADIDAGRIDALAVFASGGWWVVDWKTTLPDQPAAALAEHREQLERYASVARASGASEVTCSLVAIDSPHERAWHWRVDLATLEFTDVGLP
jgi:ATP-dependent exoDNAse (exonuclease V) beta subunit